MQTIEFDASEFSEIVKKCQENYRNIFVPEVFEMRVPRRLKFATVN